MTKSSHNSRLGEAVSQYLADLPFEEREARQQEIYKFIRWYGWDRAFSELSAPDVASYAQRLSLSDTDYIRKFEIIRAFLTHAKKNGWSQTNLAVHFKTKKGKSSPAAVTPGLPQTVPLTRQGFTKLESELAALKRRRNKTIDEIRRAAADKDFRENAPLAAAREEQGHLEGRIRELEELLKSATIINEKPETAPKVIIGKHVILCDLKSGKELRYRIVSPKETDPSQGMISSVSPIGKAIIGCSQGDEVEIKVPAGKLRYRVVQIEH